MHRLRQPLRQSTSSAWSPKLEGKTGCSRIPRKRLDVVKMCADCRVTRCGG